MATASLPDSCAAVNTATAAFPSPSHLPSSLPLPPVRDELAASLRELAFLRASVAGMLMDWRESKPNADELEDIASGFLGVMSATMGRLKMLESKLS